MKTWVDGDRNPENTEYFCQTPSIPDHMLGAFPSQEPPHRDANPSGKTNPIRMTKPEISREIPEKNSYPICEDGQ
jgi:hypothetical protein